MKKEDVLVSIVIPCYNVQSYIEECLNSLINQTYETIEIICVDDGSTDLTVDIICRYMEQDDRIKLIQQENQYAGVARNNGMTQASGTYIIFLDSDDYFDATLIEKLLQSAVENDSDIVLCDGYFLDNQTYEISEPSYLLNRNILADFPNGFSYKDFPDKIFFVATPAPWNKLYKMSFIHEHNLAFQNIKRCNDDYFVSTSLVLAKKITFVAERLLTYRTNNNDSLQGYSDECVSLDFYMVYLEMKEKLLELGKYDEVEKAFINKVVLGSLVPLRKQRTYENFLEAYSFIKDVVFREMKVYDYDIENIFASKKDLVHIKEMDAAQFLFYELQTLKESFGEKYVFPHRDVSNVKNIAIYGAGDVGKAYYRQVTKNPKYKLVAWYDRNYLYLKEKGYDVQSPEELDNNAFEKIVIAVNDDDLKMQIFNYLVEKGIDSEKIL